MHAISRHGIPGLNDLKPVDCTGCYYPTHEEILGFVDSMKAGALPRGYVVFTALSDLKSSRSRNTRVEISPLSLAQTIDVLPEEGTVQGRTIITILEKIADSPLDQAQGIIVCIDVDCLQEYLSSRDSFRVFTQKLFDLTKRNPWKVMCLYDQGTIPPEIIEESLLVHPSIIVGGSLMLNGFCMTEQLEKHGVYAPHPANRYLKILKDQDETRKALEETENRYRLIFETVIDFMCFHDMDGYIKEVQIMKPFVEGFIRNDIIGLRFSDLIPEKYHDKYNEYLAGIRKTGREEGIVNIIGKDSKEIIFEYKSVLVSDETGPVGVHCISRDATEHLKSQQELKKSEEKYRDLFENVSDYIYYHDLDGWIDFEECNRPMKEALGYSGEENRYSDIRDHIPEKYKNLFNDYIQRIRNRDKDEGLLTLILKDGKEHVMEYKNSLVKSRGEPVKVRGIARDITDRLRANARLKESEEKYRSILQDMEDLFCEVDLKGNYTLVNASACRFTGYTMEELIGMNFRKITEPETDEGIFQYYNEIYRTGRTGMPFIWKAIKKNGEKGTCEKVVSLRRDKTGKPVGFRCIARDITERLKAENKIRESEEKFSKIFLNSTNSIAFTQYDDDIIMDVNNAWIKTMGYSREEALGSNSLDLGLWVNPDDRKTCMNLLSAKGTFSGIETSFHTKSGPRVVQMGGELIHIKNERYILWEFLDITERKKAESEMAKLVSVIEQTAESIIITDPMGTIQYVNPAFEKITGYTKTDAIGKKPSILKSGEHDEAFYKDIWNKITKGEIWSGQIINKNKDKTLYHEHATISPLKDGHGAIVNFVAVKKDITKEIQLEEQLLQSQKLEAIGTLAGGIAHDFNNLLTVILGFSELALENTPPERPERDLIKEVLTAGKKAGDLVTQILSFSRQMKIRRKPVQINSITKETIKLLKSTIPASINIISRIEPSAGPVEADPTKIHQIIMNLCTNAYHAMMPDGGDLTITLDHIHLDSEAASRFPPLKEGDHIRLLVSDTGCGMSEETMKRIFDPFFTTKEKGKGTGLGLSTVYGIIADLEGSITVSSSLGQGTTFCIYLPVTEHVPKVAEEKTDETIELMKGNILLVDDEKSIIQFTSIILEQLGFTVTSLTSSIEALMLFRSVPDRYDLVITDYVMPEMNGVQLAREIMKIRSHMPIILVTGYSENIDKQKALGLGFRCYIEKPFDKMKLAKEIMACMECFGK